MTTALPANLQKDQAEALKKTLHTFVLDAEGDLATALETYSADQFSHWSKTNLQGVNRSALAIDMFLSEGQVAHRPLIDICIDSYPHLSPAEQALAKSWQRTFNGLFKVLQVTADRYELMNWLTEKRYWVEPTSAQSAEELARLGPDEIVVTRLAPGPNDSWMFSGPLMLLGKLGRPKLAVAIGNFKNWFPQHLYGDAPELLEAAWASVEHYHQDFVDFFGSDRLTLSGHELNKKLQKYQEITTRKRLQDIGIDGSKSLKELVSQAGLADDEVAEAVESFGEDGRTVDRLLKSDTAIKMAMPPINLPDDLRRAEAVTVFVHPRWGQTFLKDYVRLTQLLDEADATGEDSTAKLDPLVQRYLQDDTVNVYVWHCLADDHAAPLLAALGRCLQRPTPARDDLDDVLQQAGKPLTPQLPEIASVPMHLQELFEAALHEVNQSTGKKKSKGKRKQKTGFAS